MPDVLREYNESRAITNPQYVCHAPFNNMYFNIYGQAAPCWLTLKESPTYPAHSIRDLWFGERFSKIRQDIRNLDLSDQCQVCDRNIRNRVFTTVLAKAYDNEYPLGRYPSIMEFELSNLCNLECVMCKGMLSSSIRRNRDRLPPVRSPYDDRFVEQLTEFIPHLEEARFNGGEPLMQKICWDIWEKIAELKPGILVTLATNGTVLNERAKLLLERCRFRVNLSLDSLDKKNYETIRKNANFEKVMKSIEFYGEYCRARGTNFCIMVNPMRMNWREMPEYVRFCSERGYGLWFNTIWRPPHLALWNLPSDELERIHDELDGVKFGSASSQPLSVYRGFVDGQLKTWIREQKQREKEARDFRSTQERKKKSKEAFLGKLAGMGARDLYEGKLGQIETAVRGNLSSDDLYFALLQQPLDIVIDELKTQSLEQLTERAYYKAGYY
jgi:organic radical activating enzyme